MSEQTEAVHANKRRAESLNPVSVPEIQRIRAAGAHPVLPILPRGRLPQG